MQAPRARLALLLLPLLLAGCAHGGRAQCPAEGGPAWRELRSAHFRMRTDMDAQTAYDTLLQLERYRLALRLHWGEAFDPPVQVEVIALRHLSELREFARGKVSGYALRRPQGPLLVFAGREGFLLEDSAANDGTPLHELAHLLGWYAMPRQPRWLSEGLATYLQTVRVSEDGHSATTGRGSLFWLGQAYVSGPLPLVKLWEWERATLPPTLVPRYHGSSWLWVHYLVNHHPQRFADFQRRLGRGEAPRSAFGTAFAGIDWPAEEAALAALLHLGDGWAQLSGGFIHERQLPPVELLPQERPLEPAEVHALRAELLNTSPRVTGRKTLAAATHKEVSAALAEDPDGLASRLLEASYAETVQQRLELARALTRSHPDSVEAWRLFADSLGDDARRARAYARVLELAPEDAVANHFLAWSSVRAAQPERALPPGKRAVAMAPWSPSYLETYAAALAGAGQCREAVVVQTQALSVLADATPAVIRQRYLDTASDFARCAASSR